MEKIEIFPKELDEKLSGIGHTVTAMQAERKLKWKNGIITLRASAGVSIQPTVLVNFELNSGSEKEFESWLLLDVNETRNTVEKLLVAF